MSFISYAQNYEDLMLHRALGHVKNGFYVDVGAQHAVRDSVTAAFYERGWRGINIEPIPKWARLLRRLRPRDVNLELAIHPTADAVQIHEVPGGLSTSVEAYADQYRGSGLPVRARRVAARRLDDVLAEHAGADIHFLKIDVEGAELQVLQSLSLGRCRPWVMLVEATRPGTTEVVKEEWEHLVIEAGYRRVYWDGLNVFYVAEEHAVLADAFSCPPNVFDKVQLAETVRTITRFARRAQIARHREQSAVQVQRAFVQRCNVMAPRIADLEQAVNDAADRATEQDAQLRSAQMQTLELVRHGRRGVAMRRQLEGELAPLRAQVGRVHALEHELAVLRGSSSWLVTAPLRLAISVVRREVTPRDAARRVVRGSVRAFWVRIRHRTAVARRLQRVTAVQPRLHAWLQRAATQGDPTAVNVPEPTRLGAKAQVVFNALSGAHMREQR